jgi:hypothetical protein
VKSRSLYLILLWFSIASILLVSTGAYGQSEKQAEVKIKNTSREIQPGLYECIIYLEMSKDVLKRIDDVTYTLPSGYPNRKQKGKKIRSGVNGFFSSSRITTAETVFVNVKIDYKGPYDLYLSYKLNPLNATLK